MTSRFHYEIRNCLTSDDRALEVTSVFGKIKARVVIDIFLLFVEVSHFDVYVGNTSLC